MTPDIDLANVPSEPKAALGYAELHALWKADEDAYNAGRQEEAALVAVRHAATVPSSSAGLKLSADGRISFLQQSVRPRTIKLRTTAFARSIRAPFLTPF
jgi:hypothetical protein